jgi:hypothetical protein
MEAEDKARITTAERGLQDYIKRLKKGTKSKI